MRAVLVNDSLLFYGQSCTDEEGYFSSTDVPKYVYLKNLNNKRIFPIRLSAEPLAVHLKDGCLFIASRKGTLDKIKYSLSVCNVFKDTISKNIGSLPVSGTDVRSDDIWFLGDSLLMSTNKLCVFTDTNILVKQIKSVPLDTLKKTGVAYLGYGGQNQLVFKTRENKISFTTFIGENTEEYRKIVEDNIPFECKLRILNFCIFNSGKTRYTYFPHIKNILFV